MEFLTWWFDTHYFWSTFLTPFATWMWLIYQDGNVWREIVCAGWWLFGVASMLK